MGHPEMQEVYISVDVETAGPIPGKYSLLSIGASVVGDPDESFYAELQPLNENAVPEALAVSVFSLKELAEHGESPLEAIRRFNEWITKVSGDEGKPVFVGFNAGFDWSFVNWYFHTYTEANPFGFAPLDIKAYYMGMSGCLWKDTTSSKLPGQFQPTGQGKPHNALEDALAQGEIFEKILTERRDEITGEDHDKFSHK